MVNGISSSMKTEPLSVAVAASPATPTGFSASPSGDMSLSTPTQQLLGTTTTNKISTPVTPLEYEVETKGRTNEDIDNEIIENNNMNNKSFNSTETDVSVLNNCDKIPKLVRRE